MVKTRLRLRSITLWLAGILTWSFFALGTAHADNIGASFKSRSIETYKVSVADLSDTESPQLDWRNPNFDIQFETPVSDWVEEVELFVKIHAEGNVSETTPLFVQFNNAEPVRVDTLGHSIEAKLSLDTSNVKAHRNTISIRYGHALNCVSPEDGSYSLDLNESLLVVKVSTPSRNYYLREVAQLMSSKMTMPRTVNINAYGPNKLKYEALAAQGLALNMAELPYFNVEGKTGDMQLYVGLRNELKSVIKGTELEQKSGPVIGVTDNTPLRLVLTADTEAQLTDLVEKFASYTFPEARRTYAFSGEFIWQNAFKHTNAPIEGKTYLYSLGNPRFERGWGNSSEALEFDVENPLASYGKARININRSPYVSEASYVDVSLNDYDLGRIPLTRKRNSVDLEIPAGVLTGTSNRLVISPDLTPGKIQPNCSGKDMMSNVVVATDSFIQIKGGNNSVAGDLTRLAANGYPFSADDGKQGQVVFATKTPKERAAALRVFAHLGTVYGSGWTQAEFYSLENMPANSDKHSLHIGPHLDPSAPKGLANMSHGRLVEPTVIHTAQLGDPVMSLMSVRTAQPIKGGIAAIYETPGNSNTMRAYLTTSRGQSFSRNMNDLVKPQTWNKLQGSMSRWQDERIEMVKTAFEPGAKDWNISVDAENESLSAFQMPSFNLPSMEDFKVDLSPVMSRLELAAVQTRGFFSEQLNSIISFFAGLLSNITPDLEMPKPTLDAEPFIVTETKPSTPEPKPLLRVAEPAPIITAAVEPAHSSSGVSIMDVQTRPQYVPGATLRGLSNATTPAADIGPAQYEPMGSLSEGVKSAYEGTSSWMGGFVNKFMVTPGSEQEKRANLLIFAVAIVLILLLMTLLKTGREPN